MSESDKVDIKSILTELRSRVGQAGAMSNSSFSDQERTLTEPLPDVATLYSSSDICREPFRSHRRFLGKPIIRIKNFAKELLIQILERQVRYNTANTQVVKALRQHAVLLAKSHDELRTSVAAWRANVDRSKDELASRLADLACKQSDANGSLEALINDLAVRKADATLLSDIEREQKELLRQIQNLKHMALDQQRRLAIVLEEIRKRLAPAITNEQLDNIASEQDHFLDSMFLTFEDRFRGTRKDITERLRVYLPHIAALNMQTMPLLDLGCGRGEFLELLRDNGVKAKGVDVNRVLVDQCRSMDLDVTEADALSFLRQQKDHTLAAVSAIHLLEHLPFRQMIALLDEVLRVLKPGGLAIFETPNPENVLVGSSTFYLDPTHNKPLPAPLLNFILEERGFCRVQTLYLHSFPDSYKLNDSLIAARINELFYGPRDYALLACRV
jgi:SAM-dependent methyltransferase